MRSKCLYAQVFEPVAQGPGPSGLNYWPRPFVFRARHLDGRTIAPGETFYFDLHVFSLDGSLISYFERAFAELAHEGLGPRRAKAELQSVLRVDGSSIEPMTLDLESRGVDVRRLRVDFLSPTELKHDHRVADLPEFGILFGRVRDRISTLRALYGEGPLEIDFRGVGERASKVTMTRCEVRREEAERLSTRTGQRHSIGGFVGFAEYAGDLGEFLPYLEAARWVGVGRQSVWGKGEIAVSRLE